MRSLSDLRAEVQLNTTPGDIVEAIIYKSDQKMIPKSQAFLQQVFFNLQQEEPELLCDFIFDESGLTPFSDELDSVLFRLESSNVLHTLNPAYESYQLDDPSELSKSYAKLQGRAAAINNCALLFSNLIEERQVDG